jgi:hypothetical protein
MVNLGEVNMVNMEIQYGKHEDSQYRKNTYSLVSQSYNMVNASGTDHAKW